MTFDEWYAQYRSEHQLGEESIRDMLEQAFRAGAEAVDVPLTRFVAGLERSLSVRYTKCDDAAATPSSLLRAVLNAVCDARAAMGNS